MNKRWWFNGWMALMLLFLSMPLDVPARAATTTSTDCNAVTEIPASECEALVALYNSTNGPNWTDSPTNNWAVTNTPCSWSGVTCQNGHVTTISRDTIEMNGPIPPEIGNLIALQVLYLPSNQLTSIPAEIGNLSALQTIILWNNQLTSIPPEIGNLISLTSLTLSSNYLTSIPPELWTLTALQKLDLSYNQLTSLPPEVGNLTALTLLHLSGNHLTSVPPEIGDLIALQNLRLLSNYLTSLPLEIGNLSVLTTLVLGDNYLCELPVSLTNLTNLTYLYVNDNYLMISDPALHAWLDAHQPGWELTQTPGQCPLNANLLSIYLLQFDGYLTSTVYLDVFYNETIQSLVAASLGHPEKTVIILTDRGGSTPDAIFKIHNGIMTNITAQWAGMTAEVDSTDGAFLGDFVWWARGQYPAARTTLTVIGHGLYAPPEMGTGFSPMRRLFNSSWAPLPLRIGGSADWSDVNPQPGIFSTYDASEMARIGSNDGAAPLDVIDFSQCFGASVEEFYPLRNYARMLTGAPNYAFYDPAMTGAGLTALDPAQTPAQMATALINAYHATLPATEHPRALVAVDATRLDYLKERLDWLAFLLQAGLSDPVTRADYRAKILAAYNTSLHYDTTGCSPQDWKLCPPDAMVDVGAFALQLQAQFGALSPVGLAAGEVAGAAQAAVLSKVQQNGTPWFGAHVWDFTPGVGLSLYADFGEHPDSNTPGGVILNGIAGWYNNTVSTANPHPYEFIVSGAYGATWADVLASYWAGTPITTELCLPAFPNIQELGDIAAVKVLFPIQGWPKVNTAITPTVVFSTAATIHNPQLAITITHNGAVIFTDTLYLGYRAPGTYTVAANHAWTPTTTGPFTVVFKVDSANQIVEGAAEANNTFTMSDIVQAAPPCARPVLSAPIVNGQQWFASPQISVNLVQTAGLCSPVTQLVAQFYTYQPGQNPGTQIPIPWYTQTLSLNLPQNGYALALPAGTPAGVIVVHLWPFSNLGGYGYPTVLTFNYIPPATAIDDAEEHFSRFAVNAGEQVNVACQATGSAQLYAWEPGNPATALTMPCGGSLPLAPTQAGEYIVSVAGLADDTLYTLSATRGNAPLAAQTTAAPVEYVTRVRPTFIEPLPELLEEVAPPSASFIVFLPSALR